MSDVKRYEWDEDDGGWYCEGFTPVAGESLVLASDYDALSARLAEAEREADLYHVAMASWRSTKMKHGLCQPRERMACTHCNAVDRLDAMLAAYKGQRLVANVVRATDSAEAMQK